MCLHSESTHINPHVEISAPLGQRTGKDCPLRRTLTACLPEDKQPPFNSVPLPRVPFLFHRPQEVISSQHSIFLFGRISLAMSFSRSGFSFFTNAFLARIQTLVL